ncbi:MAG: hypothetical protein PHW65_02620 [Dehalococcoidales bacterium]|nr:hypothetical protein [Dehalococcoidales bacterium]
MHTRINILLVAALLLITSAFAQDNNGGVSAEAVSTAPPAATPGTTTTTATVTTTTPAAQPTTVTVPGSTVNVPQVTVGTKTVDMQFDITVPANLPLQSGKAQGLCVDRARPLTEAERCFMNEVPDVRDSSGQSYRELFEATIRANVLHIAPGFHYGQQNPDGTILDYGYACRLHEPAAAGQPVTGRVEGMLRGTGTAKIEVPTVTVSERAVSTAAQTVCVSQPAPVVCVQPAPQPPPIVLRPVYLQVPMWAQVNSAPTMAPGTNTTYGQPFFTVGFSYSEGARIGLSNNSSSNSHATGGNATGGNATGGNGYGGQGGQGGQGGYAWQNQGQGQGQLSWNNLQAELNNFNNWYNQNYNYLQGGNQSTDIGIVNGASAAAN